MKRLTTLKSILSSPLFRKSIITGFSFWVTLIIPLYFIFWVFINWYEESKNEELKEANEQILANVFSAQARYGDFVNARGFVLEKAKPMGLKSITICNGDIEVLPEFDKSKCSPRSKYVEIDINDLKLQLVFHWSKSSLSKNIVYLIAFGISILISAFFIFLSVVISYINTVKSLKIFSSELSELAASDRIPEFPSLPEVVSVVEAIKNLKEKILLVNEENFKMKAKSVFSDLAKQVSHDIRSPLSALGVILDQINNIKEEHRVIVRNAVYRISDIANTLLQQAKQQDDPVSQIDSHDGQIFQIDLIPALVESIVSEKRVQYSTLVDVEIKLDLKKSYGAFANVILDKLKRTLSNLINNAVEAFEAKKGQVLISVEAKNDTIEIEISDNGIGIPNEVLSRLGKMFVTHGKESLSNESGTGLGVYYAKKTIESLGGQLNITTLLGKGSTFKMIFPRADTPLWFVHRIQICEQIIIVILDDDMSIHEIWKERLRGLTKSISFEIINFLSAQEFISWYKNQIEA